MSVVTMQSSQSPSFPKKYVLHHSSSASRHLQLSNNSKPTLIAPREKKSMDDNEKVLVSSALPPLAPSRAKQPLGRTLIIRTEFVYTEEGMKRAHQVCVRGDWNNWKDIRMIREQGRTWCIVTPVSTGYHEFQYIIDGLPVTSNRHPTTNGNTVNWRNILGPANYVDKNKNNTNSISFQKWINDTLQRSGLVTHIDHHGHDEEATIDEGQVSSMLQLIKSGVQGTNNDLNDMALPNTTGRKFKFKGGNGGGVGVSWLAELGFIGFLVVAISAYLICVTLYGVTSKS